MLATSALFSALLLFAGIAPSVAGAESLAQAAGSPAPQAQPAGGDAVRVMLQPALDGIRQMIGALDTGHWKAPGEVRAEADRNVASIQRDLETTLPDLIAATQAAPGSASAAFAVYRNVDALYDVLLRVEQTAELAAPDKDASAVSRALDRLESSRRQLGDAVAAWAQNQESDLTRLRSEVARASAAPAPAPAAAGAKVVDDGPAPAAKPKRKKKPATPAQTPAAQTAPQASPPTN